MITASILWLIGWQFSCGLFGTYKLSGRQRFKVDLILLSTWPVLVGDVVRELIDGKDSVK